MDMLAGRGSSRRAGLCSSSPGGIPPGGVASLGTGYPLGYPDIRQVWAAKQPSAAETAPAGGYPLALAGIRQRIADIRGGLSATISRRLAMIFLDHCWGILKDSPKWQATQNENEARGKKADQSQSRTTSVASDAPASTPAASSPGIIDVDDNDSEISRSVLGNVRVEGQKAAKRKRADECSIEKIVRMQKELVQISRDRLSLMKAAMQSTSDNAIMSQDLSMMDEESRVYYLKKKRAIIAREEQEEKEKEEKEKKEKEEKEKKVREEKEEKERQEEAEKKRKQKEAEALEYESDDDEESEGDEETE
ncbi:uncharacterized protein PGTG_09496 [Puccinia graminis f. sp. tritici CRL 75-36-700-3]|uniref:No apical meristem-associated C-terminal domain-containing protein n=1 Tax=Puccinia graminis f. sp. tritici (strain CRL 75-36-700-3 / race SCCL) TaxID=418459 RepID=E3KHK8_PUCGT|nr:uncharacterized protein PGTG_09496 [Puccinia graminis f. sp. tritici CRL 75-36-700-3]EFP83783.2 hypothetical protein PGTG_09496 [Puccinia graminis f. sp. tritici CRL 75-36-700-3]